MRVGYIRVSTTHQNTDRQEDSLEKMNVEKLFIEKASGKDRNRPQLKAMLEFVQPGDVVVVHELFRKYVIESQTPCDNACFVQILIKEAGMSLAGARTYATNLRREHGMLIQKKKG